MAAHQQSEPQRLLFVFTKNSLPDDHSVAEAARFEAGRGGGLEPVMCVDKPLDELTNFADLVKESEQMEKEWHMVLVACLFGKNGVMPTTEEAVKPLDMMVQNIQQGANLSGYMAFDAEGNPLQFI